MTVVVKINVIDKYDIYDVIWPTIFKRVNLYDPTEINYQRVGVRLAVTYMHVLYMVRPSGTASHVRQPSFCYGF